MRISDWSSDVCSSDLDRIERIAQETGADLVWRPFLVGGVFNTVNPSIYQRRENPIPVKDAYYRKDMNDWAELQGIRIGNPPVFPVNSVKSLRGEFLEIEEGISGHYSREAFESYWTGLHDHRQANVLIGK